MDDACSFPKCKKQAILTYLERGLCDCHWQQLCNLEPGSVPESTFLSKLGLSRIDGEIKTHVKKGNARET